MSGVTDGGQKRRIAICIIARNEADTIGNIVGQLASQTIVASRQVDQILVVSNGSSDATAAVAEAALDKAFASAPIDAMVHDTPVGGKARAWNLAVHELLDPGADFVIFMDADIELADHDVLETLVCRLAQDRDVEAVSGFPVKDIARKSRKSLIDRFSLAISNQTPAPHALNGSLYAARMSELRRIWLPVPTPGEDGVLSAMIHTGGFTHPPLMARIVRVDQPTHYFEAHNIRGFFAHECRMTLGTAINGWIFERLWAGQYSRHVGELVRDWNQHDPEWIERLVRCHVAGRWWALPPRMLAWRLYNLRGVGWRRALLRMPFSIAATILNIWPCVAANRKLKRRGAASHW